VLEKLNIADEQIKRVLQENYALKTVDLEFLPLGNDANTWVYRTTNEDGTPYLLKVRPSPFYEASCIVPHFLKENGVIEVVGPLPNKYNQLWTPFEKLNFILYPFIDAEIGFSLGMTAAQWRELGKIVQKIHRLTLPPEITASIRKETFTPPEVGWIREFDTKISTLETKNDFERRFVEIWTAERPNIETVTSYLEKLAGELHGNTKAHTVCHADLHPGNIFRNSANQVWVIDWDEVKFARKERDFLFVKVGDGDLINNPFFQGYGETDFDWIAFTYYWCERVAQDIYAYTHELFYRPDLATDASLAQTLAGFNAVFAPEGEIDAAFAAAKHLPAHHKLAIPKVVS
jgi:spectinomycin phosphotransferase